MDDFNTSQGQESLYQVVLDLERSERKYHEQLSYLSDLYILHLKTCVISGEEVEKMLLTKIKDMMDVSVAVYTQLGERLKEWDEEESHVGDIFLTKADLWDLYGYFSNNLESALSKYDEKMMSPDFAALVSLKQGMDNVSLKDLILLPMQRLKHYKEFFEAFLEKTVTADFTFSHPDFSNVMECKKLVESLIPSNYEAIVKRKQLDEYSKIESMLGDQMGPEFSAYIKHIHEEPASSKRWKKRSYKKTPSRLKADSIERDKDTGDRIEIGGRKFKEDAIAPDILDALRKDVETQVMVGIVSPKPPKENKSSADNYVTSEEKVKVRWETEVHNYNIILFKQCMIFAKVRNKSMKISRIIKLRNMWLSEYRDSIGFGQVENAEKKENVFIGGWLGTEGWTGTDDELLQRVIFNFPNKDVRRHWYTLLQRYIKQSREKNTVKAGHIKVYFKGSDSKLSVPTDSIWQGMSCQDIEVDINQTVEQVIENAVGTCQMIHNTYTLTFIILQNMKIVYEEVLVWMEMPLLIQNDTRTMFTDGSDMHLIFVLRPHLPSEAVVHEAPNRQRLNTLTTFFRKGGRAATASYSRLSTNSAMSERPVAAQVKTNLMFGVPLSRYMSAGADEVPSQILEILVYIYTHCYNSEGIFRVPGSRAVQRSIEDKLDAGQSIDWVSEQGQAKCYLPNVAASLIKTYFRSLPGGLFPKHLFAEFETWRADGSTLSDMKLIVSKIPDTNTTIIRYTFHMLRRIVDYSAVNLMTAQSVSTCIGPSLVTWPEDANALSIHADQYRRQTPSVVVQFLLDNTTELFGPAPNVLARHIVMEEEVLSRRSKQSHELGLEESSDEETDKSNIWLRSLLRSSINEHNASTASTSSSMFVEIGSPCLARDKTPSPVVYRTSIPSPIVVPHQLVKEVAQIQTCHSQALQDPQSINPEQCDMPDSDQTPTESKTFFDRFSSKKSRNSSSKTDANPEVSRKKGSSIRRSRKSKKEGNALKCPSISDISSEDEINKVQKEAGKEGGFFCRSPGSFKKSTKTEAKVKKTSSFDEKRRRDEEKRREEEKNEGKLKSGGSLKVKGKSSIQISAKKSDEGIHKVKEHPVAKRVLVKHRTCRVPLSVQHAYTSSSEQLSPHQLSPHYATPQHCNPLVEKEPAKEGHDLAHLVSSLEKLTNPRLAHATYKKFGGSIGTESGTSSNEEESAAHVEQESYV